MKINSKNLIQADQAIDRRGPVLSIISNWVDLSLKIGIKAWQVFCPEKLKEARQNHPNSHYWEYLQNKSWSKCCILSIPLPILTNWIAGKLDTYNVQKAERVLQDAVSLNHKKQKYNYFNYYSNVNTKRNEQGADKVKWAVKTLSQDKEYMMTQVKDDELSSKTFDSADIALLYDREFLIHALSHSYIQHSERFAALKKSAPEYVLDCQVTIALNNLKGNSAVGVLNTVDNDILLDRRFLERALQEDRSSVMQAPRYKQLKQQYAQYVTQCEKASRIG
jgi:hypothetical protein